MFLSTGIHCGIQMHVTNCVYHRSHACTRNVLQTKSRILVFLNKLFIYKLALTYRVTTNASSSICNDYVHTCIFYFQELKIDILPRDSFLGKTNSTTLHKKLNFRIHKSYSTNKSHLNKVSKPIIFESIYSSLTVVFFSIGKTITRISMQRHGMVCSLRTDKVFIYICKIIISYRRIFRRNKSYETIVEYRQITHIIKQSEEYKLKIKDYSTVHIEMQHLLSNDLTSITYN